ncbi:1-aminocyclopropane-1-carboxylate oxidase homolog 12-like [Typha angustifolia]|uniref:1-aminocyclopropane-1-carboxylate oxidase homolog 12-like n=1 Tax=Typha angustifolia TaxID=59011 RepID=UPI003C2C1706
MPEAVAAGYDRKQEVKQFDDTKAGVKGLVDSGITKIPRIFLHSHEDLPKSSDHGDNPSSIKIPIIDLKDIVHDDLRREAVVAEIREASASWGFFQLVGHGVPTAVLDEMIEATRSFHEQGAEEKAKIYTRDPQKKVRYASNFDLYQSKAANWRDTVGFIFDGSLDPDDIPVVLREATMEYRKHILGVGETMCELLSEALGLRTDYLRGMNCGKNHTLIAHYYPPCPEPKLTLGTRRHTDPAFLTILFQDGLGGLQVFHHGCWVDVSPLHGALVVNIGDFLQLVSNDKFKSVEHRVLALPNGPRISVAMFLIPSSDEQKLYGPVKELLSDESPPLYREFLVKDYMVHYFSNGITGSPLSHFKV